jgi:hypothetical protein
MIGCSFGADTEPTIIHGWVGRQVTTKKQDEKYIGFWTEKEDEWRPDYFRLEEHRVGVFGKLIKFRINLVFVAGASNL